MSVFVQAIKSKSTPKVSKVKKSQKESLDNRIKKRIRRTRKEIEAGMPAEIKAQGVTLKEFLKKDKKPLVTKSKRIRRTKEEIDAGMSAEDKRKGLTLEAINRRNKKTIETKDKLEKFRKQIKKEDEKKKIKRKKRKTKKYARIKTSLELIDATKKGREGLPTRTVFKDRIVEKKVEVPTIKEVRILNGTKSTDKTVQELLQQELNKCKWEWKEVKETDFQGISQLTCLGNKGWKFTHEIDWKIVNPEWKNKPRSLYFQRPVKNTRRKK